MKAVTAQSAVALARHLGRDLHFATGCLAAICAKALDGIAKRHLKAALVSGTAGLTRSTAASEHKAHKEEAA